MPGRRIRPESAFTSRHTTPAHVRRREVLRGTLARLDGHGRAHYRELALANLARWEAEAGPKEGAGLDLRVLPGDWGDVTQALTREWGTLFAVLNMANAYWPGGGYVEGMVAQEENLFRRTDCHFSIPAHDLKPDEHYRPDITRLLEATDGRVYLDTQTPRVCIRGAEDRSREDLGYPWLADDAVFPFTELRAAAVNLKRHPGFDPVEMGRRVDAQFDTLIEAGVRHAVLSAFGCGAFGNPAREVARLYRDAIAARAQHFDCIAFGIFHAGYGPDNYTPFREVLLG
jgi:hypothetical protein